MSDSGRIQLINSKIPDSTCLYCNKNLNGAASFTSYTPNPDDITICVYCFNILVFTSELKLRKPNAGELSDGDKKQIEEVISLLYQEGIRRPQQ
jgi:hypothetical protein